MHAEHQGCIFGDDYRRLTTNPDLVTRNHINSAIRFLEPALDVLSAGHLRIFAHLDIMVKLAIVTSFALLQLALFSVGLPVPPA